MIRSVRMTGLALAFAAGAGGVSAETGGDAEEGARLFRACAACHQIGEGAEDRVGPHLNDIVGRPAAAHEGYRYSPAMVEAAEGGLVWDAESLDAYLEDPRGFVPRTRMSYRGMRDAQDRADVIAFLATHSEMAGDVAGKAEVDEIVSAEILAMEGDPAYGEYLSGECTACHQTSGANDGIPGITGWPVEDFVIAMHAYKTGVREHPVMEMMAGRLSNEEIAALAAYFAEVE
ncbi:c-type cytochrome [Roseobacter sp. HKCCA0434]|uniref:c-type cytochrome n=1 Tax=Roseobacter sp. HKCCA0434 TaxID=3079297 RepID=UPI00290583BD|nr:c-type cytochrome [Roseobacter sp. HKCCA0434]